jgi:nucleoside-diphosphate-sugar epimerase
MCDTSKLTNSLGSIHYRPFKEAIEETVDWYRKEGWI